MRLIEFMESHMGIAVYHGGRSPFMSGPIETPFFCTPVLKMARTYAWERGYGNGAVFEFELNSTKVAIEGTIFEVAKEMGISIDDRAAYELVSPQIMNEAEIMIEELLHRGFECAFIPDLAADCPFTEHDAYCVLNPAILGPWRVIETGL